MNATTKSLKELGKIILDTFGREAIERGYKHNADDLEEIGRSALAWNDINRDGSLN